MLPFPFGDRVASLASARCAKEYESRAATAEPLADSRPRSKPLPPYVSNDSAVGFPSPNNKRKCLILGEEGAGGGGGQISPKYCLVRGFIRACLGSLVCCNVWLHWAIGATSTWGHGATLRSFRTPANLPLNPAAALVGLSLPTALPCAALVVRSIVLMWPWLKNPVPKWNPG